MNYNNASVCVSIQVYYANETDMRTACGGFMQCDDIFSLCGVSVV